MIKYISTRGQGSPQSFEQVLLTGLAPDGGLYVPQTWPKLDLKKLQGKSYIEVAEEVIYPFVAENIDRATLRGLLNSAYGPEIFRDKKIVPLHKLYGNVYALELFHGPTIAFKDVALQFLGRLFDHVLSQKNRDVTIVGATSGDTGSAAIEGCRHSKHTKIFILHPEGRVSDVQRRQMTTVDAPNVHNIALQGTFDDCQNMVKAMFAEEKFRDEMNLSAVNSINWARIVAQIVYYVTATLELGEGTTFVVPTGNFGNVFAGYCARQMGVDLNLAISTNRNDILTRFFESGTMKGVTVEPSISPSMDIQISSNFERYLFDLLDRDSGKLSAVMREYKETGKFSMPDNLMKKARAEFSAYRADDTKTLATIKKIHDETGYTLDPHTAVGMSAVIEIAKTTDTPVVGLACAHPAKFPDAVAKATGQRPPLPAHLSGLLKRPERLDILPDNLAAVQDFIRKNA